jgi:beta-mannanase
LTTGTTRLVSVIVGVGSQPRLFVWNPNACVDNVPFTNNYPGNAYVDILRLDLYDATCTAPSGSTAPITWKQLANEPAGLTSFEAFVLTRHEIS